MFISSTDLACYFASSNKLAVVQRSLLRNAARFGEGWKLRTFYISGGLKEHLAHADMVEILTLEGFVAKANQGRL